ncbi:hypothetical protein PCL_07041 [Purpureocillium lilacinum]|uniref:Uncharacterized protein n=1 Tax=Purpureocillium lilacinum TaxID=33203 RepID=A0A2U3DT62_PURLI|nr:hypothetical protein Purlil1_13596 [Purpureocillium lilacinum]PWI65440.1 hypothetical protein PCL_07041 [Purpureocillium lilacinum]
MAPTSVPDHLTMPPPSISNNSSTELSDSVLEPYIKEEAHVAFPRIDKTVHGYWSTLTLNCRCITIPEAQTAIRMIDRIVSDKNTEDWQRRLAQMELVKLLHSLENMYKLERNMGNLDGRPGEDNSSLAHKAYYEALEGQTPKPEAIRRLRWSKGMSRLVAGSMFLAFAYTNLAETKTKNFSVKAGELDNIGRQLLRKCRERLGDAAVFPI